MTDPKHIPFLLELLNYGADDVRQQAFYELAAFGPTLKKQVRQAKISLDAAQRFYLSRIYQAQSRVRLRQMWPQWMNVKGEYEKLEQALNTLSDFLSTPSQTQNLTSMLNSLAFSYRVKHPTKDAASLAKFLFKERALLGNEDDYYNPQNSNLKYVIKHRRGIPISLACVYMLVGYRLGIKIEGCNFPGHFLARIFLNDGKKAFVDCFSSGQIIEEHDLVNFREDLSEDISDILTDKPRADLIVRRFLANLIRAYQIQEDDENCQLMVELFKDLEFRLEQEQMSDITPEDIIGVESPSKYSPGSLVYHNRYGYRGIVVDVDEECLATDDWYYGNQTQPDRSQPWAHVLVDGSDQVTYVAQSNLEPDDCEEKIEHPLVTYFFEKSGDGDYVRNENPWPETDF